MELHQASLLSSREHAAALHLLLQLEEALVQLLPVLHDHLQVHLWDAREHGLQLLETSHEPSHALCGVLHTGAHSMTCGTRSLWGTERAGLQVLSGRLSRWQLATHCTCQEAENARCQ